MATANQNNKSDEYAVPFAHHVLAHLSRIELYHHEGAGLFSLGVRYPDPEWVR